MSEGEKVDETVPMIMVVVDIDKPGGSDPDPLTGASVETALTPERPLTKAIKTRR
jgi:hypothetical protein